MLNIQYNLRLWQTLAFAKDSPHGPAGERKSGQTGSTPTALISTVHGSFLRDLSNTEHSCGRNEQKFAGE